MGGAVRMPEDDDWLGEPVGEPMAGADWCESCERWTLPHHDGSCSRCGQHCYP